MDSWNDAGEWSTSALQPLRTLHAAEAAVNEAFGPHRLRARLHPHLESAEAAWRQIEADGRCTAFQRLDWARTIVQTLIPTDAETVFVIEIFDKETDRPLMLMPLVRRRHGIYTLMDWLGRDVCDYCAPLLASDVDWTVDVAEAAWRALQSVLPRADLIRINHIPALVSGANNPLGLLEITGPSATTSCGLSLHGDPETVVERCCHQSFVRKLGKTGRRLAQRGTVRLVEARTEADFNTLFDTLLEQRRARFHKLGRPDLLDRPEITTFYRAAGLNGLRGGAVRLLGLRVGDQWAGTYYGLLHDGVYQGLIVTIADDTWRTCSPGLHVHAHVIRWARANGSTYFDMSVGSAAYKDAIGGRRSALYSIDQALSVRGRLIVLIFFVLLALRAFVQKHPRLLAVVRQLRQNANRIKRRFGADEAEK